MPCTYCGYEKKDDLDPHTAENCVKNLKWILDRTQDANVGMQAIIRKYMAEGEDVHNRLIAAEARADGAENEVSELKGMLEGFRNVGAEQVGELDKSCVEVEKLRAALQEIVDTERHDFRYKPEDWQPSKAQYVGKDCTEDCAPCRAKKALGL